MSPTAETVLSAALTLSADDRTHVIEALLAAEADPPPPFDEAWREVVARRSAELGAGTVRAVPWDEVRSRLFERVGACG